MSRSIYRVVAVALVAAACESPTLPGPGTPTAQRLPELTRQHPGQPDTMLIQTRIAQRIAERAARGEAAPALRLEFHSAQGSSLAQLRSGKYPGGGGYSFTAKTILRYKGPQDAGLKRWPAMQLTPEQSQKFGMTTEEFVARYKAKREAASPGFWQRYQLGFEPRTYTVVESETRIYPVRIVVPRAAALSTAAGPVVANDADASSEGNLVFGFGISLPKLEKSDSFGFEDVEELTYSFFATGTLGLRMPMLASLQSPQPMNEGSLYAASSALTGQDWSASQYGDVGLDSSEPADGHEAYFFFGAKACVNLNGIIDPDEKCLEPNVDKNADFATPLGSGNSVDLPSIEYELVSIGVAGLKFVVTPSVGSDKVTADWSVGSEASGGGGLTYSNSGSAVSLDNVLAIDGPGTAAFQVDNFQYFFNQFAISPGLKLFVDLDLPFPIPDWEDSFTIGLGTYNLSDLIPGLELAIPIYASPPYTGPSSLALNVAILNVAPTAALTLLSGGTLEVINGIPTIMGSTGETFSFKGESNDPGRDDLTLSWDWGDGPPAPDISTLHALGAPVGPNNTSENQTHAFSQSCMYSITFKSVDDDAASAQQSASILVTDVGNPARLEGFWQKQFGQSGNVLDPALLNCYLLIVERVSRVYNEVRSAATFTDAYNALNVNQNSGSVLQKLDRDLLVSWLNFAAGAIGYKQMVDTNGDGIVDTRFVDMMTTAENVRLNPASTPTQLKQQSTIVHFVSQTYAGGKKA